MAERKQRQDTEIDPAVRASLGIGRQRRKVKAARDAERIRVRLDIPRWLKDALGRAAEDQGASMNQVGGVLLAYALKLYASQDADLLEALDNAKTTIRSISYEHGFELAGFADAATDLAE